MRRCAALSPRRGRHSCSTKQQFIFSKCSKRGAEAAEPIRRGCFYTPASVLKAAVMVSTSGETIMTR